MSQLGVDTAHHVITHIQADFADKKDNQCLKPIVRKLKERLWSQGLYWQNILADTGYSSGENYSFLEQLGVVSYIPPHGTYQGGPEGFTYIKDGDYWCLCANRYKQGLKNKIYLEVKQDATHIKSLEYLDKNQL